MTLHPGDSCVNNWMLKAMAKDSGFLKHKTQAQKYWTINLSSRVLTSHVPTKFHEDWMLTRKTASPQKKALTRKTVPSFEAMFFNAPQRFGANRQTDQQTNRQTGQKQYVPHYYMLTRFYYSYCTQFAVMFKRTRTMFAPSGDMCRANVMKFHENLAKNKVSLFLVIYEKLAHPPGGHVFQWTGTNFQFSQDIIRTKLSSDQFS
ncbi:hypothetical protein DPMN_166316 [Dreissena polymorpha]|uniref:Uncharacterized protein n=1 Tax=Dreissena polymorpha TaxID=45954 RepID=A0A9D4EYE8_DREPO|nr:hypothetical protein DPMN_166316 [Dreissena polymorpha]